MRGLDLFCGAGGATRGYQLLGHQMTGVDWRPQPRYCGEAFIEADVRALLYDEYWMEQWDFIHASPPCQIFSSTARLAQTRIGKMDLLTPVLEWAMTTYSHKKWVIENVPEAPLPHDTTILLCGSQFPELVSCYDTRRQLRRHRKFWIHNFRVEGYPTVDQDSFKGSRMAQTCAHNGFRPIGVYGALKDSIPGGGVCARDMAEANSLMGIDWMLWRELREAIPPAYTQFVGQYLEAA